MLIQKKNIIGIILCIMLFSASVPILMGVRSSPDSLFKGEDVLTLSQTNVNTPLSEGLAVKLNQQDFVEVASPEIYAFTYIINRKSKGYEPVVARGGVPEYFLAIEEANLIEGSYQEPFLLLGKSLSERTGLKVGHSVTIPGSISPVILELTVTGIFECETSSNSQMLIPLSSARKLMALNRDDVNTIRLKTGDQDQLIDFLTEEEYSVIVNTEVGLPISVNENKSYEQRVAEDIALRLSDSEKFSATNQSFVSTFVQKGAGTVGVVVLGFITLNALLSFVGITAILARAVIERKKDIGILAAIGADKKAIYLMLLKDLFTISVVASGVGVLLGFITAEIVKSMGLIVAFGLTIQPAVDLILLIVTFFVAIIIACTSGLMVSSVILSERPSKLIQEIEDVEDVKEIETLVEAIGV